MSHKDHRKEKRHDIAKRRRGERRLQEIERRGALNEELARLADWLERATMPIGQKYEERIEI